MLKFVYTWHRRLALLVALPVLIWTLSGLSHPLMAVFSKPRVERTELKPTKLQALEARVGLREVLTQANLTEFNNVRVVTIYGDLYYQVRTKAEADPIGGGELRYFHAASGDELARGDFVYAEDLARRFLGDEDASVNRVAKVSQFTPGYQSINRLLPAHRVSFNRSDSIELYVHTFSDRLGLATDGFRQACNWVFLTFHTWNWLGDTYSPVRATIVLVLSALAFLAGLSGVLLYTLLFKQLRKHAKAGRKSDGLRRLHRILGLAVSLAALAFTASGLFQAFGKYGDRILHTDFVRDTFTLDDLALDPFEAALGRSAHNFSMVRVSGRPYVQLHLVGDDAPGEILYLDAQTGEELDNGDQVYAGQLAARLIDGCELDQVGRVERIEEFTNFYPLIFKRIPVQNVRFEGGGLRVANVETSSGHLASYATVREIIHAQVFLMLHKYHWLDSLGPVARDSVMSFFAFLFFCVSAVGVVLHRRLKRRARISR